MLHYTVCFSATAARGPHRPERPQHDAQYDWLAVAPAFDFVTFLWTMIGSKIHVTLRLLVRFEQQRLGIVGAPQSMGCFPGSLP